MSNSRSRAMVLLSVVLMSWMPGLSAKNEEVMHMDAWSRATPPGASTAAIYGRISNLTDQPMLAKSISVSGARHVMVHETVEVEGMASMRHASLKLESQGTLVLGPGGLHIMVMGISEPFKPGCRYPFTITWESGQVTEHETVTGSIGQSEAPEDVGQPCP